MIRYVLALEKNDRIHVATTEEFIEHIGAGAKFEKFDPQRVIDLVNAWDVYDEEGFQLGAKPTGATVELIRVIPEKRIPGDELIARINDVLEVAQSDFNELRQEVLDITMDLIGTVAKTPTDDPTLPDLIQKLADSGERLRRFVEASPFPVVHATLPVVLAALAEAFRARPQTPPDKRGGSHDDLHEANHTH